MLKKNILSLKTYFEIKPYEVPVFRVWCIILGFFIPVYGVLLQEVDAASIEYISHRLFLGSIWMFLFFASFKFEVVKKNLIILSYLTNVLTVSWMLWIGHVNNFSANYSIGLFLVLCMGIIFRDYKEMIVFYLIILSLLAVAMSVNHNFGVDKLIFGLSLFILLSVYLIIMFQRNYINRNLIQVNKELSLKNKELEQFVFISSHDLKTPLRNIESFAFLLKKKADSLDKETIIDYTDYIINGTSRMNNILDDLLKYSVIGKDKLDFKETDIVTLINKVAKEVLLDKTHANSRIVVANNLPERVVCVPSQIMQLFQNLIENGLKYNTSDQKQINITFHETKDSWWFQIKDNGIGIEDKYNDRIFEIFQRLHTNDEFKGTGIGLAICKRIVEIHGGTISIESKEGEGSVFQFSISKNLSNSFTAVSQKKVSIVPSFFKVLQGD